MTVYWKDQATLFIEAPTQHLTRILLVSWMCCFF